MRELSATVKRLCEASVKDFSNPFLIDWPEGPSPDHWFFTPELISLYGTPHYDSLADAQKQKLSFYEVVNFFSMNIHGEKSLVEGLARRLYEGNEQLISPYLHHFLDEENKHMVYFGGFCQHYAGKIYPDRKVVVERDYAPGEEDFLFFAKVLIFEEIVDVYNIRMSQDDRLDPLTRQINLLHHRDEARHLVFGRQLVKALFDRFSSGWSADVLHGIREYLAGYISETWKEYYNPDIYRDTGFADAYEIYQSAFGHQSCREHRKKISKGFLRYFLDNGILEGEPSL